MQTSTPIEPGHPSKRASRRPLLWAGLLAVGGVCAFVFSQGGSVAPAAKSVAGTNADPPPTATPLRVITPVRSPADRPAEARPLQVEATTKAATIRPSPPATPLPAAAVATDPGVRAEGPPQETTALTAEAARETATAPVADARSTPAAPAATGERVAVRQPGVFLRASPSRSSAIVSTEKPGRVLTVYARKDRWIQVGDDGPIGWAYDGLLEPKAE